MKLGIEISNESSVNGVLVSVELEYHLTVSREQGILHPRQIAPPHPPSGVSEAFGCWMYH